MAKDGSIAGRLADARTAARADQAEVKELSAKRLAVLKTWAPARLARLGRDPDLTDADQRELQNFIANRAKPASGGKSAGRTTKVRRWLGRRRFGLRMWTGLAFGSFVLIALGLGYLRTPSSSQVLKSDSSILISDETGTMRRVTLAAGTVVRLGDVGLDGRSRVIRYWVPGRGYRSVIYYAEPPAAE